MSDFDWIYICHLNVWKPSHHRGPHLILPQSSVSCSHSDNVHIGSCDWHEYIGLFFVNVYIHIVWRKKKRFLRFGASLSKIFSIFLFGKGFWNKVMISSWFILIPSKRYEIGMYRWAVFVNSTIHLPPCWL